MAIKNFGMKTVHSYLSDSVYYIPDYQREYSWIDDQLEDFWQDLENAINTDRHHFFGQIVIHEDNGKQYIIDGQQRTTTAVIFLAVLRDWFSRYETVNDEALNCKEDIRIKYIGRWTQKKDELRLHLGIADRDYFKEQIQKAHPSSAGKTPSQKRILNAYTFFEKKLNETLRPEDNSVDDCVNVLQEYYDTILHSFDLMAVTTDDINEAFIIFETLNARGKELETADLLKNYVFMQAGNNLDNIKNKWQSMLESLDQRDEATKFIRYYWNATHPFTRERNLYKEISKTITAAKCDGFVVALVGLVDLYNALSKPEDNKFYSDKEISALLVNLSVMKATTFYPVLIAMQIREKDFDEASVLRVLKAIEVLVFRNFVVGGQTANKYELFFAKIANFISDGSYDSYAIVKSITDQTNDDETFKRNLIGLDIKTVTIAKYVLREIEDYGEGEKKTSKDNKTINLEHIMPKNNSVWKVDSDMHDKYLYRLANQTLLLEEYNKSISNKDFSVKKTMYQQSNINMTKDLCNYPVWDAGAINKREQILINTILQRWELVK